MTYTIGLTNTGSSDADNATVTDPLPADTIFQGVGALPPGWAETDPGIGNGGTVTFTDTNPFAVGDSSSFTITAQVNSGVPASTTVTNTANATAASSSSPSASASASLLVVSPIVNLDGNTFLIERDAVNPNWIDITTDGVLYQQWANTIEQINLTGLSGNDRLTVDSSYGLINNATTPMPSNTPLISIPINYDASTAGIQPVDRPADGRSHPGE